MTTRTYILWRDKKIDLGWLDWGKTDVVKKDVRWDERKTKIESARIDVTARATDRTGLTIRLNFSDAVDLHWELGEDGRVKTDSGDCIGYLRNGENTFEADFHKDFFDPVPEWVIFDATLVITYEGEEPHAEPWWKKYVISTLALTSAVLGPVSIGIALRKKEERK